MRAPAAVARRSSTQYASSRSARQLATGARTRRSSSRAARSAWARQRDGSREAGRVPAHVQQGAALARAARPCSRVPRSVRCHAAPSR